MRPSTTNTCRTTAALAAGLAALVALTAAPASAGQLTTEQIQADDYLMARLRAGQSWDTNELSIGDLRPGAVDQTQLEIYVKQQANAPQTEINPTLEVLAALGPQIVTEDGDVLVMQTASASWGEPGIMPRSHLGADGVWEFPRLPTEDEREMLVGQQWRVIESIESQLLFLGPDRRFGWDDFADLVNPLQHIPLVSIAYRAMTGDRIYGAATLIDMGFGPLAGAGTIFQLAYQSTTGQSLEDQAVAAVFGPRAVDTAALYTASDQVADREPLRRGSNQ